MAWEVLKVLICDDEYIICDGLCSFPWDSYGCTVIGSAEDGAAGLALAEKYRPDIILTDIKMPEMNGLDMADAVKKQFPETEIILLSGYDEFEFAQQALRIGVVEYILKPVNFKDMHDIVKKVCSRIRKNRKKKADYTALQEKYAHALPQIIDKVIADILLGLLKDKDDAKKRLSQLHVRLDSCVVVYGRTSEGPDEKDPVFEPALFDFAICNICEEIFTSKEENICAYSVTDTMGCCFIVSFPDFLADEDNLSYCISCCETAQTQIRKLMDRDISFGISNVKRDIGFLNMAYTEAIGACEESSFIGDGGGILRYSDTHSINLWDITDGEKRRIVSEVARGHTDTAGKFISMAFEKCTDIQIMRYAAIDLLMWCFHYACADKQQALPKQANESDSVLLNTINQIFMSHSRREIISLLISTIQFIGNRNRDYQINRNQEIGVEIEKYIYDNYAQDLSLDGVADHFKISRAYVNRLLKKQTGKTFLETLTSVRLAKASQLLGENRYKVRDISEMVGYRDFSYFIRVFKKKYGVTPNNYKKN